MGLRRPNSFHTACETLGAVQTHVPLQCADVTDPGDDAAADPQAAHARGWAPFARVGNCDHTLDVVCGNILRAE